MMLPDISGDAPYHSLESALTRRRYTRFGTISLKPIVYLRPPLSPQLKMQSISRAIAVAVAPPMLFIIHPETSPGCLFPNNPPSRLALHRPLGQT